MDHANLPASKQVTSDQGCDAVEDTQLFTCFNKLPLELRLMIWRHSVPEGRLIPTYIWQDPSFLPKLAILSLCHEVRDELLPKYKMVTTKNFGTETQSSIRFQVDPERDAVLLDLWFCQPYYPSALPDFDGDIDDVQHLVLDATAIHDSVTILAHLPELYIRSLDSLTKLANLKSITLLPGRDSSK